MQKMDLIRKIVANVAKTFEEPRYVDALVEGGLIAEENGVWYPGENAADFCFNVYAEMVEELIQNHGLPEAFRARMIKKMGDIAPLAFDKMYKSFHRFFDRKKIAWNGAMLMVLFMAEPTRNQDISLKDMCDIFEGFYELKPESGKVIH